MQTSKFYRAATVTVLLFVAFGARSAESIGYDPEADPFSLLQAAEAAAANEGKLVLVMAGGDWCIWCHYLHAFIEENSDIADALDDTFVTVKAYMGDENDNAEFFATLPKAVGYPHFWVVDADGTVLASQGTAPLEDGQKSYDRERFMAFIEAWRTEGP